MLFLKEHAIWKMYLFLCFNFYFTDISILHNLSSPLQTSATFPQHSEKAHSPGAHPSLGSSLSLASQHSGREKKARMWKHWPLCWIIKMESWLEGRLQFFCIFFFLCTLENKSCICTESICREVSKGQFKNWCDIVNVFNSLNICCSFDNEQLCTLGLW